MGCSGSHFQFKSNRIINKTSSIVNLKMEKLLQSKKADDLLIAFIYLDKNISEVESISPPAVYGEAYSRLQQIRILLQEALENENQNESVLEESSIRELFIDLGLKNSKTAAEHEEFIAKINRRALHQNAIKIWEKAFKVVEDLILKSSIQIKSLQNAYYYQEKLLVKIFGKPYQNEREKMLEKEVDRMRYYKDILHIGILQWEACSERIATGNRLIEEGFSAWTCIENESLENKIKSTITARDFFHEAILLIQSSDELLTDVKFPYCTARELKGVLQMLDYVFTDIFIPERYSHATEVYRNFLQRAVLLDGWMKEILNSKMKKDFLEIQENISDLSKILKNERIEQIKKKLNLKESLGNLEGKVNFSATEIENLEEVTKARPSDAELHNIPASGDFLRLSIDSESKYDLILPSHTHRKATDIMNYFQSLIENKKMTMWPSKRIDELQNILMES